MGMKRGAMGMGGKRGEKGLKRGLKELGFGFVLKKEKKRGGVGGDGLVREGFNGFLGGEGFL